MAWTFGDVSVDVFRVSAKFFATWVASICAAHPFGSGLECDFSAHYFGGWGDRGE